jgi:hypothetical protein
MWIGISTGKFHARLNPANCARAESARAFALALARSRR